MRKMQAERKTKKKGNRTTVEAHSRLENDLLDQKAHNEELH